MIARPASRRWLLGAFAVVALLGTACAGGDDSPSGQATVPKATTSTTTIGSWAVPDPIDAAYVERVLAELDRIDGDAARLIVAAGELTPPAVARMRAIYGTDELNLQLDLWGELIAKEFAGLRRPPGNLTTRVESVPQASRECVVVLVGYDYAAVATNPPSEPKQSRLTLRRLQTTLDPDGHNKTGWAIDRIRLSSADPAQERPCA